MNILDFNKWSDIVKEGFDAKIEDDKDSNDEIEIEAHNKDNTIKYVVNGDIVKSKKIISTDDGYQEEENDVNDKTLEDDIIDAVDKINDVKDRIQAKEFRRLTGGDRSTDLSTIKEIKKIFNSGNSGTSTNLYNYNEETEKIFTGKKIIYNLNISNIEGKYNIDKAKVYHKFKPKKCVGKGEYLLPLLFDDVYKQKVYGENTRGDNFIVNGDNKYYLELKSPNAQLNLSKYAKDYIKTQFNENSKNLTINEKNTIYKNAITSSFLNYALKQKKFFGNLYMCIFGKTANEEDSPKDILFINLSNIDDSDIKINSDSNNTKSLFEEISKIIHIDNIDGYTQGRNGKQKEDISYSFYYTYEYVENELKINCILMSKIIKEATILSRDNFINEIYKI